MPVLNRILPLLRGGGARGGAGLLGVASGWPGICSVFSFSLSIPGCTVKPVAADRSLGLPAGAGEDPDIRHLVSTRCQLSS